MSSGYLLNGAINDINNQGYFFDRIDEFNIITIADKMDLTYDFYIKHNMCALEWKLNAIINKNKNLINKLDRSEHHLLIRNFSNVPFNNWKMYVLNITDDYDNMTMTNCTNNESNIDNIIPSLLLTIPCGLSFLCLMSLMVFTLFKSLFKKTD